MMDEEILDLVESAKQAKIEYEKRKNAAEQKMLEFLRERMPVGTVINIKYCFKDAESQPLYLLGVKVMAGNARGTGLFRIEEIRAVELHLSFPFLSKWSAHATPISEITGKDMKATAGHSLNGPAQYITLQGSMGWRD
jgi:hypothetical protein